MVLIIFLTLLSVFMIWMGNLVWQDGGKIGLYMLIAGILLIGIIVYSFITNIVKEIKEKKSRNTSWQPQKVANSFTKTNHNQSNIMYIDLYNNAGTNKENDIEILKILSYNKNTLQDIIVPLIKFANEFDIKTTEFSKLIRLGFENYKSNVKELKKLNSYIIDDNYNSKQNLENYLTQYDEYTANMIANCMYEDLDLSHNLIFLKEHPEFKIIELKNTIKTFYQDYNKKYIMQEYIKQAIKNTFTKYFTYENELSAIEENKDLSKMLNNSIYKFDNFEIIAEKTHELFLDFYEMTEKDFPLSQYCELLRVYMSTKNKHFDIYNLEELSLDIDITSTNLKQILDNVIENKIYNTYEIDKLVTSLTYHKLSSYEYLPLAIKSIEEIPSNIAKIKKVSLKEDLLTNDYNNKQITIDDIDLMSGVEFENFLYKYFKKLGYKCETTKASGDQGVDLIAIKGESRIAIQAKCYSSSVGNHAVMEAIAGMKYYKANQCMVITNSHFTKTAKDLAQVNNVVLWDRKTLIEKLKEI